MKRLLISILTITSLHAQIRQSPKNNPVQVENKPSPRLFEVSKVSTVEGKQLLNTFFNIIKEKEEKERNIELETYAVFQKINDTTYLIGDDRYFRTLYCLRLKTPRSFVDEEWIKNIPINLSNETFSYTSTSGGMKTIRVLYECLPPEPYILTKEKFVERLKNGEIFQITVNKIDFTVKW